MLLRRKETASGWCAVTAGPLLFARYAFPPNERGLCGPDDHAALRDYATAGVAGPGLVRLAAGFAGAWPYLELIAAASKIKDALDPRVVEAYWVGNSLLDKVRMPDYGAFLEERFRGRAGRGWDTSPWRFRPAPCRITASTSSSCTRGRACWRAAPSRHCMSSTAAGSAGAG